MARLMRENSIQAVQKGRSKRTTDSNHSFPLADNFLARDFRATWPNQVWLTGITYIHTNWGWLYLSAILDVYSRKIDGWVMDDTMDRILCMNALKVAVLKWKF
ncbi:hypothetical protein DN745_18120 [Bradymonas sediminis]|uniref:Integrase catalytic domain-containing protein n=1 Tax=Bradymonas sediminis TaxID=1548548 RepID=A0A2Z4FR82_9DELT|nr:hypothetical protein DN745_18120 [Bradymonas sediminis]